MHTASTLAILATIQRGLLVNLKLFPLIAPKHTASPPPATQHPRPSTVACLSLVSILNFIELYFEHPVLTFQGPARRIYLSRALIALSSLRLQGRLINSQSNKVVNFRGLFSSQYSIHPSETNTIIDLVSKMGLAPSTMLVIGCTRRSALVGCGWEGRELHNSD